MVRTPPKNILKGQLHRLPAAALHVWRLRAVIIALICFILLLALYSTFFSLALDTFLNRLLSQLPYPFSASSPISFPSSNPYAPLILFFIIFLCLLAALWYCGAYFRSYRWQFAEGAIIVKSGVFFRQRRVFPLERVQALTVLRSPLQRRFRTCSLHLAGAGYRLTLHDLTMRQAAALRRQLPAWQTGDENNE
ncbi:MAG TPA: PH domain-containing protein [Candidatus Gallacutalibacter stercoravium]|nr:PH domain-containing protein [Candidatus Gallacutalibacter stercoravium]